MLPADGFQVVCFPVKVHRGSAGWTRAVAIIEEKPAECRGPGRKHDDVTKDAARRPRHARRGAAAAQGGFPQRPLRMVIPYAPGTAPDTMARVFCETMRAPLGQQVVPDNRPGAGGNIGAVAARAAPDGYTLLWGTNAMNAMNEFIYPHAGFDPRRDLEPIALCIVSSMVLAVRGNAEMRTLAELLAEARARPGALTCALSSAPGHVALEMLRVGAGVDILPVPYRSSNAAATALLGGEVHILFDTLTTMAGPALPDRLRPLPSRRTAASPACPRCRASANAARTWTSIPGVRSTPRGDCRRRSRRR